LQRFKTKYLDYGGIKTKINISAFWKTKGKILGKQKDWGVENRDTAFLRSAETLQEKERIPSEVRTMPSASTIDNQTSTPAIDNQPWLYPFVFEHESKQFSYGSKLRIISDCEGCDNLCAVCPAGRKYMTKVEYALLGVNHISALVGCLNSERCEDFLVKVVFQ